MILVRCSLLEWRKIPARIGRLGPRQPCLGAIRASLMIMIAVVLVSSGLMMRWPQPLLNRFKNCFCTAAREAKMKSPQTSSISWRFVNSSVWPTKGHLANMSTHTITQEMTTQMTKRMPAKMETIKLAAAKFTKKEGAHHAQITTNSQPLNPKAKLRVVPSRAQMRTTQSFSRLPSLTRSVWRWRQTIIMSMSMRKRKRRRKMVAISPPDRQVIITSRNCISRYSRPHLAPSKFSNRTSMKILWVKVARLSTNQLYHNLLITVLVERRQSKLSSNKHP